MKYTTAVLWFNHFLIVFFNLSRSPRFDLSDVSIALQNEKNILRLFYCYSSICFYQFNKTTTVHSVYSSHSIYSDLRVKVISWLVRLYVEIIPLKIISNLNNIYLLFKVLINGVVN